MMFFNSQRITNLRKLNSRHLNKTRRKSQLNYTNIFDYLTSNRKYNCLIVLKNNSQLYHRAFINSN
jgi:hypothetical protein